MDNEKRIFVAIALSLLVILGYQAYVKKFVKPCPVVPQVNQQAVQGAALTTQQIAGQHVTEKNSEAAEIAETTTTLENELYRAVLSDNKAAIKELYLLRLNGKAAEPVKISYTDGGLPLILSVSYATPAHKLQWQLVDKGSDFAVYQAKQEGLLFQKRITIHNSNYTIVLEHKISNNATQDADLKYDIICAPTGHTKDLFENRYLSAELQVFNEIHRKKPSAKNLQENNVFQGVPQWVATKGRYFSFVLKPEQNEKAAFVSASDKTNIWSGVSVEETLKPGASAAHNYTLYAGPNSVDKMSILNVNAHSIINYGAFDFIAKALLFLLHFCHVVTRNYGLAIILMSIIIGIILLPLTRKSLHSMKEMQKLQPKVEAINKECANNPAKKNQLVMELYKEHKINPMGGCLPMLLQMPIFFSLYNVLARWVELKGAHFLWIKDLSAPDALFTLSRTYPLIQDKINLLPVLTAIGMAFQQKVSYPSKEASEQQRIMAVTMPIMFCFIFYSMPSGFVLYWLTNSVMTIFVQEFVLKIRKS